MSTKIKNCRGCGESRLNQVISLGRLAVSDFVIDPSGKPWREPLALVLCQACGLLQSAYTAPDKQKLYRNYWYKSGINTTMKKELTSLLHYIEHFQSLHSGDVVLDIGANDGTLLRLYRTKGLTKVGFEPATNLINEASKGTDIMINDFFSARVYKKRLDQSASVITTIAMFYDLDDPHKFLHDLSRILGKGGIWVNQMSYLPDMLASTAFDNMCHEHLVHYSLTSFESLLRKHGLVLRDVTHSLINGGSFRTLVSRAEDGITPTSRQKKRIADWKHREEHLRLTSVQTYRNFMARVNKTKLALLRYLKKTNSHGKRTYAYGASTKGNTLLQYFGLTRRLIPKAVERNPEKCGRFTVATNIPIISESQARREKPDIFLVLPWHFKEEIIQREQIFLENGGSLLFPLPEPHVISIVNGILTTTHL